MHGFLNAPVPYVTASQRDTAASPRTRGVPLGTSISLLLANVAVSPLDRALERLGVSFVRYADDTVIWSRDYGQVCRAVEELQLLSSRIGAPINQEKSVGVRLLVAPNTRRAELPSTSAVSFLSHDIGLQETTVQPAVMQQIKGRISTLLYNHLLREPLQGTQDPARIGIQDRDYIAYLWQLRRYLYGALSERDVRRLGNGTMPHVRLRGAVSRFPLVDDDECWRQLDAWISTQTWLALRRRVALLSGRDRAWSRAPACALDHSSRAALHAKKRVCKDWGPTRPAPPERRPYGESRQKGGPDARCGQRWPRRPAVRQLIARWQ